MNEQDILRQKNHKLNMPYPVKSCGLDIQVKDVDLNKRTVQFIGNTYYYLDTDYDILVNGAAKKSINDRGPQSQAKAKIKHLSDHVMSTSNMIAKITGIEETSSEGNNVLMFDSYFPKGVSFDDHLIKYQEKIYDNHSIGFMYKDIGFASKDSSDEDQRKRFDEFYPLIINKEKADKAGFFYVVKEIELYEVSVVPFGANSLTGVVGIKSKDKDTALLELHKRMDRLQLQLKSGTVSDDTMRDFELQIKQIKQIMYEMVNQEPSIKDTLTKQLKPSGNEAKKLNYDYILKNLTN